MWYHAGLQLDYRGFESEARTLANRVENGDISALRAKVEEASQNEGNQLLFSKYGFGQVPELFPSIEAVNSSTEKNPILGQWFCWILVKYLTPSPFSIGYNWRYIADTLPLIGWFDTDVHLLIQGLPVGNLFGQHVSPIKTISQHGPYWYWIRPRYSYNQGGYLTEERCAALLSRLKETRKSDLILPSNTPGDQENNWKKSFTQGLEDAVTWIESALANNSGTYSAIYWEWEDDHQRVMKKKRECGERES